MYQLMKVIESDEVVTSGETTNKIKHLKRRLSKMRRGWIKTVGEFPERIISARGFSREGMEAIQAMNVEAL